MTPIASAPLFARLDGKRDDERLYRHDVGARVSDLLLEQRR